MGSSSNGTGSWSGFRPTNHQSAGLHLTSIAILASLDFCGSIKLSGANLSQVGKQESQLFAFLFLRFIGKVRLGCDDFSQNFALGSYLPDFQSTVQLSQW